MHVTLRRSRQTEERGRSREGGGGGVWGVALKGDFSTHPVCDRFLTLTRRCQVYTLNHDITRAALRGDSRGDFRLFKLRTRDHIASLKTAKQRHLNRVPTSQAACHPPTEGSRDCDPPLATVPRVSGLLRRSQMYKRPKPKPFKCTLMSSRPEESQVGFDLGDRAHPSRTHGIKTDGSHCFPWEKDERREKMAKPKILLPPPPQPQIHIK